MPPIVLFVGLSGTGKTTVVEGVVRCLKNRGYTVAALKHSRHEINVDVEGTDSWRFTNAGADISIVSSPGTLGFTGSMDSEMEVEEIASKYAGDMDILLAEGYKHSSLPKIEIHRTQMGNDLLCRGQESDPLLIAVVSDADLEIDVPVFDLDDIDGVCDFIESKFLK
ncbi:MAG: molybdopterin-guanine dinucleotide biosynthesis protein B [bacterium]